MSVPAGNPGRKLRHAWNSGGRHALCLPDGDSVEWRGEFGALVEAGRRAFIVPSHLFLILRLI